LRPSIESRRDSLPTKLERNNIITNGQKHQLVILVRSKTLRAFFDGKPLAGCQVDDDGLSLDAARMTPKPNQVGLATWDSVYEFYSLDVITVSGEGQIVN